MVVLDLERVRRQRAGVDERPRLVSEWVRQRIVVVIRALLPRPACASRW